jgi:hypothetical protein
MGHRIISALGPESRKRVRRVTHLTWGIEPSFSRVSAAYRTSVSRQSILSSEMSAPTAPAWSFLTNHARVLLCIARDPVIRLREIGAEVGITERAAYRILDELVAAGYVSRERHGRRNHYTVHGDLPLPDRTPRAQSLGELLAILVAPRELSDA